MSPSGKHPQTLSECNLVMIGWNKHWKNIREWKLDIFLLPELFLSGYNIGRLVMERAEEEDGHFARCIAKLAKQHSTAICYGFVEKDEEALYNSALCIGADGQLLGKHQKLILPPGFENEHFVTGKQCALFSIGDFKIAILICYDAEFPETCRQVAAAGADVLIVPTALGQRWGIVSEKMIPTRAFENGIFICYANHCGTENGKTYYGGSCIISPSGEELARANGTETILNARLNLEENCRSFRAEQASPYLVPPKTPAIFFCQVARNWHAQTARKPF